MKRIADKQITDRDAPPSDGGDDDEGGVEHQQPMRMASSSVLATRHIRPLRRPKGGVKGLPVPTPALPVPGQAALTATVPGGSPTFSFAAPSSTTTATTTTAAIQQPAFTSTLPSAPPTQATIIPVNKPTPFLSKDLPKNIPTAISQATQWADLNHSFKAAIEQAMKAPAPLNLSNWCNSYLKYAKELGVTDTSSDEKSPSMVNLAPYLSVGVEGGKGREASATTTTATPAKDSQPSFSFGHVNTPATAPSFTVKPSMPAWGGAPATASSTTGAPTIPAFGFGKPNHTTAPIQPTLNFGTQQKDDSAIDNRPLDSSRLGPPSIPAAGERSAGSSNPFSFGKPQSPIDLPGSTASAPPVFSFAPPGGAPPTFGKGPLSIPTFGSAPAGVNTQDPVTQPHTAGEDGEEDETPEEPQLGDALMKGAGEEAEDTRFSVKAKLFYRGAVTNAWDTVAGVGILKVNVNRTTGKARLLLRADGTGRVVLNAPIYKGMPVQLTGDKLNNLQTAVTKQDNVGNCLDVSPAMAPCLIRVKEGADAKALSTAIHDLSA